MTDTTERLAAAERRIAQLEGRIEQLTAQLAAMAAPAQAPNKPWPFTQRVRTVTR